MHAIITQMSKLPIEVQRLLSEIANAGLRIANSRKGNAVDISVEYNPKPSRDPGEESLKIDALFVSGDPEAVTQKIDLSMVRASGQVRKWTLDAALTARVPADGTHTMKFHADDVEPGNDQGLLKNTLLTLQHALTARESE